MAYKFQDGAAALSGNLTLNGPFDLLFGTDSESTIGTTGNRPATVWADDMRATTLYGDGSNLTGISSDSVDVTGSGANLDLMLVMSQTASSDGAAIAVATSDGSTNPSNALLTFNPSSGLLSGSGALNVASWSAQNGALSEAGAFTGASVDVSGKIDGATGVDVNGTNIVDSSRNAANLGTISGSGQIAGQKLLLQDGATIGVVTTDDAITIASNGDVTIDSSATLIATTVSGANLDVNASTADFLQGNVVMDQNGMHINANYEFSLSGGVGANFVPSNDGVIDLGSSTKEWKDLYIDGVAYIDDLRATTLGAALDANNQAITNINVDGGAIDGTPIGAASAAAITATNLTSTGVTLLGNAVTDFVQMSGSAFMASGVRYTGLENPAAGVTTVLASLTSSYLVINGSAETTVNLPAAPVHGDWLAIKRSAAMANDVIVSKNGGKDIDGQSTVTLDSAGAAITLVYDSGTDDWHIF